MRERDALRALVEEKDKAMQMALAGNHNFVMELLRGPRTASQAKQDARGLVAIREALEPALALKEGDMRKRLEVK